MEGDSVILIFFAAFWILASFLIFLAYVYYKSGVEDINLEICKILGFEIKNFTQYIAYLILNFESLTNKVEVLTNNSYSEIVKDLNDNYKLNDTIACYISNHITLEIELDQSLFIAGLVCYVVALVFIVIFIISKYLKYRKQKTYIDLDETPVPSLEFDNPNDPKLALESFEEAQRLLWRNQIYISNFQALRNFQVEALIDKKYETQFQQKVYDALLKI